MRTVPGGFDMSALFDVVDEQRIARAMTWSRVNREIAWMSQATMLRMRERRTSSCHHVLPLIQWVGRTPESFAVGADDDPGELLPDPGAGRWRWYWDILDLRDAMDAQRAERGLEWHDVAVELGSGINEVKALYTTRYGPTISFAMRAARWLDRTAASFMWEHDGRGLPWSGRRT